MITPLEPIPKKSRFVKTDKPRPYHCPICTRGFVRQEHLKRHARSHTRERPFLCILCGRCFARKDLVIRHQQKLHQSALDSNNVMKNIVRVVGNMETMLPTPLKSASSQQSVSSVSSSSSNTYVPPPRKRHTSFSASTAFTYSPAVKFAQYSSVDTLGVNAEAQITQHNMPEDIPHQVGFSTPQFTGQQVVDKAIESGMLFMDPLELPPSENQSAPNSFSLYPSGFDLFSKSKSEPLKTIQSSIFMANLPSLADMLTLSSSIGGAGGFAHKNYSSSSKLNLNPFDYDLEHLNGRTLASNSASNSSGAKTDESEDPWLSEFLDQKLINDKNNVNINQIGFFDNKSSPSSSNDGKDSIGEQISGLFTSRQNDIFNDGDHQDEPLTFNFTSNFKPQISIASITNLSKDSSELLFFNENLRNYIIQENNLNSNNFPTVNELNNYIQLYKLQFTEYYPFIHLYTLKSSRVNYPILLSIAMIGALYAFHSTHSKLLSIICNVQVKKYLARNEVQCPLWLIQSLVLLSFFNVFNNNLGMTKQMSSQLTTLLKLIRTHKINLPLEVSIQPPIPNDQFMKYHNDPKEIESLINNLNSPEQQQKNFDYFIVAQERIRTCHMVHLLTTLYAAMIGVQYSLHSLELKCGLPTYHEELFDCANYQQWSRLLREKFKFSLDSKFSLIQLSNGNSSYDALLMYLSNGYTDNNRLFQNKISKLTLLSLLLSIHEKISFERTNCKELNLDWQKDARPVIDSMIKYWEILYINNGGLLVANEDHVPLDDKHSMSRLIIPMYYFLKTRRCVDFSQVVRNVWLKDWSEMNKLMQDISHDWKNFQEGTEVALTVIDWWIDSVASIKNISNEQKKLHGYKTPIFTITCIFTSVMLLSEYLKRVEDWALNAKKVSQGIELPQLDKVLYFKAAKVLKHIQDMLIPKAQEKIKPSYIDFLRIQTKEQNLYDMGILLNTPPSQDTSVMETIDLIQKLNLSSKALYLGVRILSDAPIWPIALLFAHALQSRAIYNVSNGMIDM